MKEFIHTQIYNILLKSDFEKQAAIAISKGYSRRGNNLYANDYKLIGCWDCTLSGGWFDYCEIK
jgi:hypothetical protein